jgi:hypothetical protein
MALRSITCVQTRSLHARIGISLAFVFVRPEVRWGSCSSRRLREFLELGIRIVFARMLPAIDISLISYKRRDLGREPHRMAWLFVALQVEPLLVFLVSACLSCAKTAQAFDSLKNIRKARISKCHVPNCKLTG